MSDARGPIATEGEFQGKPSLTLAWRADSPYPFSFGVTKARLVLACLAQIQAFVDKYPDEGKGNRGHGRPAARRAQATASDEPVEFPGGPVITPLDYAPPAPRQAHDGHHGGSPEERHGYTPPPARPAPGDNSQPPC